jgi:putative redox protein
LNTETYDARVVLKDGMHFEATTRRGGEHRIALDTSPDVGGRGLGTRPYDLILVSLCGCMAMDVISILRKKQQPVSGLEVLARAERAAEHPRVFTHIWLTFVVTGQGVAPEAVERSIELAYDKYCPAAAMLKPVVPIETEYRIEEG